MEKFTKKPDSGRHGFGKRRQHSTNALAFGKHWLVFPGKDNLVRVVELRMKGKLFKRPIVKLAPLPMKTQNLEEEIDSALRGNEKEPNETETQNISCHMTIMGAAMKEEDLESIDLTGSKSTENSQKLDIETGFSLLHTNHTTFIHFSNEKNAGNSSPIETNKSDRKMTDFKEESPKEKKNRTIQINDGGTLGTIKEKARANKKPKKSTWIVGTFALVFLCFGYLFSPVTANITDTRFDPQTTAYIETCDNTTEITGYWHLAIHRNIDSFYHDVDALHESVRHLDSSCQKASNNSVCSQVLQYFKQKLNKITSNERLIKNEVSLRNRRGVGMLLLGSALGTTGTMLYDWITNAFETAQQSELLDKQISVIDLMGQNMIEFNDTLQSSAQHFTEEIWATAWLSSAFNSVTETQNQIMEKITKSTMKIDTYEIPLELLIDNVMLISKTLRNNEQLIGSNTMEQALNIYKLASLKEVTVVKNSIIAIIKIPLVSKFSFECKKIIPIPFQRAKSNEIIVTQGEYVLLHQKTNSYCIKTKSEMRNCLRLDNLQFCEMEKKIKKESNVCELNMILYQSDHNCETTVFHSNEFLYKIKTATWLYACNNLNVSITCNEKTNNSTLDGKGMFSLESNCSLLSRNTLLKELETENGDLFINMEQFQTVSLGEASPPHNAMKELKAEISSLKNMQRIHHWFHGHHTIILYAFIFWISCCFILIFIRKKQNKIQHPVVTLTK